MSADGYRYDVFISYSSADRGWLEQELIPRLRSAGLRYLLDDDFRPGPRSIDNMYDAVRQSHRTLLVMTPSWVQSVWCLFEARTIQALDPLGAEGRLVPILVKPCTIPPQLAMHTHRDLTDPAQCAARLDRLVGELVGTDGSKAASGLPTGTPYEELTGALERKDWKAADAMTFKVMSVAGSRRRAAVGLTISEIKAFPCDVLLAVDRLWTHHSGGRFGFSVQWRARYQAASREAFGDAIGWRRHEIWIAWPDVTFDSAAPPGHLPIGTHLGLCTSVTAVTGGRGLSGFLEGQVEIVRSGVLDLFHSGGVERFGRRVKAELSLRDGFALWWMEARLALLDRYEHCVARPDR